MRYIKLTIIAAFLSTMFTGCSYVSDMVEGAITKRASFTVTAQNNGSNVDLTWDYTDSSSNFAGIEIYRTLNPNEEYTSYELVASRHTPGTPLGTLDTRSTTTYQVSRNLPAAASSGEVYFYRIGIIHIDTDDSTDLPYDASDSTLYNLHTSIDAISGYAKVVIP